MKAIVSLATDRGNYYKALCRLGESLRGNFDGDFFGFMGEHSVRAPKHLDNPYAFKIYAIAYVRSLGYKQIVWLDASVYAVNNVQPVFDIIHHKGYVMQEAGHVVGNWCNDETLEYFHLTREQAMLMPMYGNAGLLGLDFSNPIAADFFYRWARSMQDGHFKGNWKDHRHDMTCGSVIANQLGMKYERGDQLLQYGAPDAKVQNESIVLKAQGM